MRRIRPSYPRSPRAARPAGENGSAYLFALLVLLVLTVIGLSLAIVTQSEVQIGAAERTGVRVFYSSDAAIRVQLSGLFFDLTQPRDFKLHDTTTIGSAAIDDTIHASAFYPLYAGPCPLCDVNTGNNRHWAINHIVTARTQRSSTVGAIQTLYAEKTITSMYAVSPQERSIDAFRTEDDVNEIKF